MLATTQTNLEKQIRAAESAEVLMETNQGTYGTVEACRKVGCGSPEFADRNVYERVGDGARRATGPKAERAPGCMRSIGAEELRRKREELRGLKAQLAQLR
jgi:hypothetical protein